jgi:4-amino-4-deoxy-L-arabinose transferase-like glycosyltransferase
MVPRHARILIAVLAIGALARFESPGLDPASTLYTDLTDEGWWAASASRWARGGPLVLPGDYNPVLITPAWTALLMAVFAIAGPSIVAARFASAACGALAPLLLLWALRPLPDEEKGGEVGALSAMLLATSFAALAFSRCAVLEAPLMAASILVIGLHRRAMRRAGAAVGLAVAMGIAVLVKVSAVVLVPVVVAHAAIAWWRGECERGAAVRCAGAVAVGACAAPAFGAWAASASPADWAVMAGANVADKLPSLAAVPAQVMWFLGFHQLLDDAPVTMLAAWLAAGAWVAAGRDEDAPGSVRPLAALWFLAAAGMVAVLPYQPKRYHVLMLAPAYVLAADLAVRAWAGRLARRGLVCGALLAGVVGAFGFAMARLRATGAFIAQPTLHPDNVGPLLGTAGVAFAVWSALVLAAAVRLAGRAGRLAAHLALLALVVETGASCAAWARFRAQATRSLVLASREVGARVRADAGDRAVLAGAVAHTISLETGVAARWLSIEPRLSRRVVPRDAPTHLIVDDPRDVPIWTAGAPDLMKDARPAGQWTLVPSWPRPVGWQLLRR